MVIESKTSVSSVQYRATIDTSEQQKVVMLKYCSVKIHVNEEIRTTYYVEP